MTSAVQRLLSRLEGVKQNGTGWTARCPAHDDKRPSLSVGVGDDGHVLVRCHAGCTTQSIVSEIGLNMRDLMPETGNGSRAKPPTEKPRKTFATARDAVAALERGKGKRSAMWEYPNAAGEPVGVVVRWNLPDGKKEIRPVSKRGAEWIVGAMPTPRPLYMLPELAGADRVYICEGEKAVSAIRSIGLVAATSAGGSKAARHSDWSPLAGKNVVILPDNDGPGAEYAKDVVRILLGLGSPATVKILRLPELPPAGDAFDFIEMRRVESFDPDIRAMIEDLADNAEPVTTVTQPAKAVARQTVPTIELFESFPVEVLPEPLQSFIVSGADSLGCDQAFLVLPMLSALAAAIGGTRRIQLNEDWSEPSILWTAVVAESGTAKSPAFRLVTAPIHEIQNDAMRENENKAKQHVVALLHHKKTLTAWQKDKGSAGDPPVEPEPPVSVRFLVSDTTIEAMSGILLENPRGVLLVSDELSGWLDFDRYSRGRGGGDRAHWLSMFDGGPLVVDRKTSFPKTIFVPAGVVSVTGGIQPGVLARVVRQEDRDSGLLARVLVCAPPRRPKRWSEKRLPWHLKDNMAKVFRRLRSLDFDTSTGDHLAHVVKLTPEAESAWIKFVNEHGQEQFELTGDLASAFAKLEAAAARMALVIHLVRWAADDPTISDANGVDETSISAGVALSRWFGKEARRVYAVLKETGDEHDRRQLVELIDRIGGNVTVRDLMRGSRAYRGCAEEAESVLNELVNLDICTVETKPTTDAGGRPVKRYILCRSKGAGDKTPTEGSARGVVSPSPVNNSLKSVPEVEHL